MIFRIVNEVISHSSEGLSKPSLSLFTSTLSATLNPLRDIGICHIHCFLPEDICSSDWSLRDRQTDNKKERGDVINWMPYFCNVWPIFALYLPPALAPCLFVHLRLFLYNLYIAFSLIHIVYHAEQTEYYDISRRGLTLYKRIIMA